MTGDAPIAFGRNVRAHRRALTLTQEAAGLRAGMDMSYWGRIERGSVDPSLRTVTRVAAALETTPARLMADIGATPERATRRP
jgi:transcriptional regulator with XRE-family HTH domain